MTRYIIEVIGIILGSGAVSSILAYVLFKRKHNADARTAEAEAVKTEVSVVSDRIDQADKIVAISTKLLVDVEEERSALMRDNAEFRAENDLLKEKNNELEQHLQHCETKLLSVTQSG